MLGRLKKAKEDAAAKVGEMKDEHEKKQQAKWREEVMADDAGHFKDFAGWADVYEPKKEKKDKGDDSGPNAVQRKAAEKMADNIKNDILKVLMETVSKLLGPTSAALAGSEQEISDLINAANAATLTYRFEAKGKKKMAYLRSLSADSVTRALGAALEKEALGKGIADDAALSPEQVKEIVDAVVAKATGQFEAKKEEAVGALKASPLFAASGADGAQVDAGVVALQDFLRGYLESKIGTIVQVLEAVLTQLLGAAAKYKDVIKKHAAENKDGFAEGSEEYQKVRTEILGEIEKAHGDLDAAVGKYVGDLVGMMMGTSGGEEAAE